MCLIAMAWGVSAQYPLVIAANRDEHYTRPTAPLAQWTTDAGHTILSGRDLKDGGTWMGFTPSGRFAMLTNVRNPSATAPAQPRSRGGLVVDWLSSPLDGAAWCAGQTLTDYAGFNLMVGDWTLQQCHYLSNQALFSSSVSMGHAVAIPHGQVVGLSNAALNTPWPKTLRLNQALEQALAEGQTAPQPLHDRLQSVLTDEYIFPDATLPQTGVSADQERALSSVFVRYPSGAPVYGTRSSLTVLVNADHHVFLRETTHHHGAKITLDVPWPAPPPSVPAANC